VDGLVVHAEFVHLFDLALLSKLLLLVLLLWVHEVVADGLVEKFPFVPIESVHLLLHDGRGDAGSVGLVVLEQHLLLLVQQHPNLLDP